MCGICGIWNYKKNRPVERDVLQRMTNSMTHRGPDDSGLDFDDAAGVGLGFRRLAIIDLSAAGHQPMSNEDGSVWLVFNGEIYNYLDLRPHLEAKGHRFHSRTDSEVIIHQYEERGAECVKDLNGMFGLAIWDAPKQRMVFARDRVGKKPLYYYDDGQRLLFASELKAILADRSVPRELDYEALGQYLTLGYVPPPRTIFRGVKKLPPGHVMVFENGQATISRYWDWLPAFQPNYARSEEEWAEELREVLKTVVQDRLMSDVPLGAFLSGGLDSSAVVATMAMLSDQPVKTFSIGFENEKYNELSYARLVAERFNTDHHEQIVEPESLRDLLPRLAEQFDEPFADSSAIPTYYVSKMARQHVTVTLSGDGGDETLAGYERYTRAMRETRADRIPQPLRRMVFALPNALMPTGIKGKNFVRRMTLSAQDRYTLIMRRLSEQQIQSLFTADAVRQMNGNKLAYLDSFMKQAAGLDYLSQLQYVDGMSYLPEDILVKVDRTSMLNSLEARCPLLDYRFMELAASIPAQLRWRQGDGKYILKRALRGILPDDILTRSKMGFGIPLREWFRDDLSGYAADILLNQRARERGLFEPQAVATMLEKHRAGKHTLEVTIWSLLVLELWCRAYLDG